MILFKVMWVFVCVCACACVCACTCTYMELPYNMHQQPASAQEHLRQLQQELAQTQDNIADATEELQKMSVALTEDDKQALRNRLTKKISMVCKAYILFSV